MITHTGLFDNVDKLYKTISGETKTQVSGDAGAGGAAPPPPPGGDAPMMDQYVRPKLNIILEGDEFDNEVINNSLGDIESELDKLINS